MTHPYREASRASHETRVHRMAGGRTHMMRGETAREERAEERRDLATDKKLVKKAVAQHEAADHKGEPRTKLKLRTGGATSIDGGAGKKRLDRPGRAAGGRMKLPETSAAEELGRARGGRKHAGGKGTTIAVITPSQKQAVPVPVPVGAKPPMPMGPPPGAGPMAAGPMGPGGPGPIAGMGPGPMPPPGAGGPDMIRRRGGRTR